MTRVLIVDDDDRLSAMLVAYLGGRGLTAEARGDATSGLLAAKGGGFDAVVLDVMLPDLDGFEVVKRIRAFSNVPIVMLTARGEETDRIVGLELGADDYLAKPFNPRELIARLQAVLRRARPAAPAQILRSGDLTIDRDQRTVMKKGELRPLTSHQFELLWVLASNPGKVMSRQALMEAVRGEELEAFDRSIDVHVSRIRAAIEDDSTAPTRIVTLRGAGYVFTERP